MLKSAINIRISIRNHVHKSENSLMVTESGLKTRLDLIELRQLGYSGFLIGETLMRSGDPAGMLELLK